MKKNTRTINIAAKSTQVEPSVSAKIIRYIQKSKGMSLNEIGRKTGLSKSFISRVNNGERGLTITSLLKLQQKLNIALPLLFLEVIDTESVPKEIKEQYEAIRNAFMKSADLKK